MVKFNTNDFDTIIFDFGGVILDINPELSINALREFGGDEGLNRIEESDILWQFERGEITKENLHKELCDHLKVQITYEEFIKAWNALLLGFKDQRIKKIKQLAETHRLIMLSNTNEIHFAHFSKKLLKEYNTSFNELFNKVYLSHKMGLIKPDKLIFKQVIDEQNLTPEKTLFIEDTEINAEVAREFGIHTLVIPRNGTFYDYFK